MMKKEGDNVIICLCEDVTYDDIVKAVKDGYRTLEEIKRYLRCGMGACQGRTCMRLIASILAKKTRKPINKMRFPISRPSLRPIALAIAGGKYEGEE